MATNIMEGVETFWAAADDDDGIGVDLEGEVVAHSRNFAGVAGEEPALAPDGRQILAVDVVVAIKLAGQRPARPGGSDQGG